jgi:ribosomal protein L11 methyltransferase
VSRQVRVSVPVAEAELAADALWQAGAVAIEEQAGVLVAGVDGGGDPAPLLAAVSGRWPAEVVEVDLHGALDAWRPHARAVTVGERLVIRPPWVEPPSADQGSRPRVEVVIDPGRAFGQGAHPSTRLVLEALDELVDGGERALDLGCGSGVLAIAALALGAASAVGVDIEPVALAATRDNAARNGVADRLAMVDDVGRLAGADGGYDLVVANMLLPQLVAAAPTVTASLATGGVAVVSGVLVGQRAELLAACAAAGLAARGERVAEGWLAVTLGEA